MTVPQSPPIEIVFVAADGLEILGGDHSLEVTTTESVVEFVAPVAAVLGPTGEEGPPGPAGPIGPKGDPGPEPDLNAASLDGGFF